MLVYALKFQSQNERKLKKLMKANFKALMLAALLLLSACSQTDKEQKLLSPLDLKVNQGIFYILEGKIGTSKEPLYLSIQKQAEGNFSLSAVFLNNNEIYFEGDIKDNNFSFTFNELNYNKTPIQVDLSFNELNEPKILAQYKGTLDGLAVIYELSPQRLNSLEFIKGSLSMTKKGSSGANYKSSLSDEVFFIPEYSRLDEDVAAKINAQIAFSASNFKDLETRLQKDERQRLENQKEPSFYAEYYNLNMPYYIDDKILVFTQLNYEYLGGAHGLSLLHPLTFSLQNGELLSSKSKDLFKDTEDKKLLALLLQGLEEYNEKSFFKDETGAQRFLNWDGVKKDFIALPQDFFISSKGVEFVFAPYEIASYAEGYIRIRLSFEALKPFIKPDSPFAYFLK